MRLRGPTRPRSGGLRKMLTYQDFEEDADRIGFIQRAVTEHRSSEMFREAVIADEYDAQRNTTINNYVQTIWTLTGAPVEDFTASNSKIASGFFRRLNTQRCTYLLGNGVTFASADEGGENRTKEILGNRFDSDIRTAGYYALIHGVSFMLWDRDHIEVFKITEFMPLWDEYTGQLRAGIRFWRSAPDKPMSVEVFEEDGFTRYREDRNTRQLVEYEPKRGYIREYVGTAADGVIVAGESNYSALPIVPMWGSRLKQSTLVGMRQQIDSFDLIMSGFANDLSDVSSIYWIVENCGGMSDRDLARFRDRLKITHIANANTDDGGKVSAYTNEVPHDARKAYLDDIRSRIYEDFGGLDVHVISAGATNDHIEAAYQPLDEEADDFEYQVADAIMALLALLGIDDVPTFKRNRISNQIEQVQMLAIEAQWLDEATILAKLPNVSPDEVKAIMEGRESEEMGRMPLNLGFGVDEVEEVEEVEVV